MIKRKYNLLLAARGDGFAASFADVVPEDYFNPMKRAKTIRDARRLLAEEDFDVVAVAAPLSDESGLGLAGEILSGSSAGVLVFAKGESYDEFCRKLLPFGALVLPLPTSSQLISQALILMCGTKERLRSMEQANASIEEKLDDMRIISRAKLLLISQLKMTEAQAHRYIEKQAMDRCVSSRSVAENIIATYK